MPVTILPPMSTAAPLPWSHAISENEKPPINLIVKSLKPEKVSCDASDYVLQSPIKELDIKANVHDGVETCLQRPRVLACNLPLQDLMVTSVPSSVVQVLQRDVHCTEDHAYTTSLDGRSTARLRHQPLQQTRGPYFSGSRLRRLSMDVL